MARTKKSERIYQMWSTANSQERIKWQSESQKGYDFYLNEQLTEEEKDSLKESGMPTFEINRITPIIETMKYFVLVMDLVQQQEQVDLEFFQHRGIIKILSLACNFDAQL